MAPVQRLRREFPPKHFSLRLHSFSKVAKACSDVYETVAFTVENFSWCSNLGMKKKWGYDQLLSLDEFKSPNNGYLVNDCCEFGVELIVVASSTQMSQTLSMIKPPPPFRRTFKDFSKLGKDMLYADPSFTSGGKTWKLRLYPKGTTTEEGNSLSLFLELVDGEKLPLGEQVLVEFKLRVIDQHQHNHLEKPVTHWFTCSSFIWGYPKFMPLGDLYEDKKGFVVNDTLIVEVEFVDVSSTDIFTGLLP